MTNEHMKRQTALPKAEEGDFKMKEIDGEGEINDRGNLSNFSQSRYGNALPSEIPRQGGHRHLKRGKASQ